MQKCLREQGSLQVIELAKMLNKEDGCKEVTRNTVNTLLYTVKDRFEKVGYGRFNIIGADDDNIEKNVIKKLVMLLNEIDSKLLKVNFSKRELKIIDKIKKEKLS